MNVKDLMEKRDHASKAYRDLVSQMQKDGKQPGADERAKMENMVSEIEAMDAQIREAQGKIESKVNEMDEALQNLRIDERVAAPVDNTASQAAELREFMLTGKYPESRAMTTGTGSTGGYLVPDKFAKDLREYQQDLCPIYDLATKTIWDSDAIFPVVTAFGATSIVAEGTAKTAVTPTLAQTPLTGYQFIYAVDVPETLIRKSAFNIDQKLAGWWAKSNANCMEDYFAVGTGDAQPTGIAAAATTGTDTAANSAIAANDVINWYYKLGANYRKRASWIFADSTIALIRKITNAVTTSGALNYVWMPGLGGTPDTLMGKPIYASDGMPALTAGTAIGVFGDISEYQIVEFGQPSLIRDPYTLAKYGQVSFIGYRMLDGDLPVAEAVVTCPIAS